MKRVILESPYAGHSHNPIVAFFQRWANRRYARACVRHSLGLGEAPIASHLLYTQPGILRDSDPTERQWGINAGLAWREVADASVVYVDRGLTRGMKFGIVRARQAGLRVEFRAINRRPFQSANVPPDLCEFLQPGEWVQGSYLPVKEELIDGEVRRDRQRRVGDAAFWARSFTDAGARQPQNGAPGPMASNA